MKQKRFTVARKATMALRQAALIHRRFQDASVRPLGFRRSRTEILRFINVCGFEPMQKDIAEDLQITPAAVTVALSQLQEEGYITKVTSQEDHRAFRISLTEAGRAVAEEAAAKANEVETFMYAGIAREELDVLHSCLDIISTNLSRLSDSVEIVTLSAEDSITKSFRRAALLQRHALDMALKNLKMRRSRLDIMRFIHNFKPERRSQTGPLQKNIADGLLITPAAVTVAMNAMEKEGLVIKTAYAEDHRAFVVNLTAEGEKIVSKIRIKSANLDKEMYEGISDSELDVLLNSLETMCGNLTKAAGLKGLNLMEDDEEE